MGVIRTSSIDNQIRLKVPEYLREHIVYENELDGPSVEWHFDNEERVGVISSEILDEFTYVGRTRVYGNNKSHLRPPKTLTDELPGLAQGNVGIYFSEDSESHYLYVFEEDRLFEQVGKLGRLFK